ncbi:hypothetical protein HMPREF9332_01768 [Alloprevotella rava F0323]|uniref:Glutamine-dependent NAD(+) synthetase n=1 Tax=Alloprevotella rava F0323 TaxID=679199 RepID=G5GDW6_9BACT|nr:NAD(+) synthase [Alloprevotella rava]EHG21249.1 hypothetical protein HMPREF9332_01768 [Alloprevotella rava F0323]
MHGFIKVAAAVPRVRVADCKFNTAQIESMMARAEGLGIEIIVFPELSITGYTCQDLFQQQILLEEAETSLLKIMEFSHNLNITTIVGLPFAYDGMLLNCAAVVQGGKIYGIVPKTYIPNYKEFYEARWFSSASRLGRQEQINFFGQQIPCGDHLLFNNGRFTFGVEICEDLWATIPPSSKLSLHGAEIIFNLSSSNELVGKNAYLKGLICNQSARCISGYVYAGSGYGESTQDIVFSGLGFIAENGHILEEGKRFSMQEQLIVSEIDIDSLRQERRVNTTFASVKDLMQQSDKGTYLHIEMNPTIFDKERFTLTRNIPALPFVPSADKIDECCEEILSIQSEGLAKRIDHTHAETVVVGISGGLDSTLALLVCVNAFDRLKKDRKGIIGITMPGFGTTDRTYTNAINLMKGLGVTIREISIKDACNVHFKDLGIDPAKHDITYENSQARERTQILMDAANQMNGFVVGTGDLSELALGWATYNGDQMSMYAVNSSIPKTLVYHLVSCVAQHVEDEHIKSTLFDIVNTPISPELIPATANGDILQKTEDLVGPYELHDFFIYHFLRNGFRPSKVFYLAQKAFNGSNKNVSTYDDTTILKWLQTFCHRFFSQQFKRSCLPDGPKVGSCSLSPRGDWRMPSDACAALWLEECENLKEQISPITQPNNESN